MDLHLEGINSLMADSKSFVDNNQHVLVQKEIWKLLDRPNPTYFIPPINMFMPS